MKFMTILSKVGGTAYLSSQCT